MADSAEDVLDNTGRVIATKDDAGHLIARLLGGEGGKQAWNLVPMNPQLNRGDFRLFEREVANWVSDRAEVTIKVEAKYGNGGTRPTEIIYHWIKDGVAGQEPFNNPL